MHKSAIPRIPLAAWITAGRRASLYANLEGFLENFSSRGQEAEVLVGIDGSGDSAETALSGICRNRPGLRLYLSGLSERRFFIESLPSRFDRAIVREAVCGRGNMAFCGSNRNAVLLCAAGRSLVMMDDDIECRPARPGNTLLKRNPEFGVLPDMGSVQTSVVPEERDILGEHLKYLADGETRICSIGFYGVTGSSVNRSYLLLEGLGREYLVGAYEDLRDSPFVTRIPGQDKVCVSSDLMAAHASYDCASVLPPFFISGRNDDGLFALMVQFCYPGSKIAYPAFGLFHNPDTIRRYDTGTRTGFSLTVSDIFMSLCARAACGFEAHDPAGRMEGIGGFLRDAAGLSAVEFTDLLWNLTLPSLAAYEEHLEDLLSRHNREPAEWASDVEALLENVREKEREPALLYGPAGCGLSLPDLQGELARYGSLLEQWPDLWDYARERNADGPCLARALSARG